MGRACDDGGRARPAWTTGDDAGWIACLERSADPVVRRPGGRERGGLDPVPEPATSPEPVALVREPASSIDNAGSPLGRGCLESGVFKSGRGGRTRAESGALIASILSSAWIDPEGRLRPRRYRGRARPTRARWGPAPGAEGWEALRPALLIPSRGREVITSTGTARRPATVHWRPNHQQPTGRPMAPSSRGAPFLLKFSARGPDPSDSGPGGKLVTAWASG